MPAVATKRTPKRESPVGQTWRIASDQFGYLMYASDSDTTWSDLLEESHVYDSRDNREIKLAFWKGIAKTCGLDADCVKIVEAVAKPIFPHTNGATT